MTRRRRRINTKYFIIKKIKIGEKIPYDKNQRRKNVKISSSSRNKNKNINMKISRTKEKRLNNNEIERF